MLVFHFTFKLGSGPLCRGLSPIRASAFDILKLAGSSSHLEGPFPRRFRRTIFPQRSQSLWTICLTFLPSILTFGRQGYLLMLRALFSHGYDFPCPPHFGA
jgi:hypothetical protein